MISNQVIFFTRTTRTDPNEPGGGATKCHRAAKRPLRKWSEKTSRQKPPPGAARAPPGAPTRGWFRKRGRQKGGSVFGSRHRCAPMRQKGPSAAVLGAVFGLFGCCFPLSCGQTATHRSGQNALLSSATSPRLLRLLAGAATVLGIFSGLCLHVCLCHATHARCPFLAPSETHNMDP